MTDARNARQSLRVLVAPTISVRNARQAMRVLVGPIIDVRNARQSTRVLFAAPVPPIAISTVTFTATAIATPASAGPLTTHVISGRPADWPEEGVMHFRLVEPRLGTLDLSCDTGYVVRSYELGFPEVREVSFPNSLDDGTFDLSRYIGARSVSLDLVLRTTDSPGGLEDVRAESRMRDALLAFLHPWARPRLLFSEVGDDRVRFLGLRGSDAPITVSLPRFNEVSVSWRAPRGLIESVDIVYAQLVFTEALLSSYTITINNMGNAPAHWSVHIEGELTSPRFTLNDTEQLWLDYDLKTGSVDIDSFSRSVFIGGDPTGYRYLSDQTTWFQIPPGTSALEVTHQSTPRAGFPIATWQPDGRGVVWADPNPLPLNNASPRLLPNSTTFASLPALRASATYGDGHYTVPPYSTYDPAHPSFQDGYSQVPTFHPGDYVRLGDDSQAWYDSTVVIWKVGPRPTINNPPPAGAPPWAWSIRVDPATGLPPMSELIFYLHPVWI